MTFELSVPISYKPSVGALLHLPLIERDISLPSQGKARLGSSSSLLTSDDEHDIKQIQVQGESKKRFQELVEPSPERGLVIQHQQGIQHLLEAPVVAAVFNVDNIQSIFHEEPFDRTAIEVIQVRRWVDQPPAMFPEPRYRAADITRCCTEDAAALQESRGFLDIQVGASEMLNGVPQRNDIIMILVHGQIEEFAAGGFQSSLLSVAASLLRDVAPLGVPMPLGDLQKKAVRTSNFKQIPA